MNEFGINYKKKCYFLKVYKSISFNTKKKSRLLSDTATKNIHN